MLVGLVACAAAPQPAVPADPADEPEFEAARADASQAYLSCAAETYRSMLEMDADSMGDLLRGEERLPDDARAVIRPLAEHGIERARAAIALRPADAHSYLLLAMNVGMLGVSIGKLNALTSGVPGRVIRAYSKALELDETCDGAGPLQIEGRFRTIVPFPYRNLSRARAALHRAATIARVKQTLFFLGDAHARAGNLKAAEETWRAALDAPPYPSARPVAGYIDLLIARRLRMLNGTASLPR